MNDMSLDIDHTGCLAFSLSGHDKGKLYMIVRQEDDFVFLSDGRLKLKNNPKKKNIKHVQIIKKFKADIGSYDDTAIKRAVKIFLKEGKEA